jgi:hypothetical protein
MSYDEHERSVIAEKPCPLCNEPIGVENISLICGMATPGSTEPIESYYEAVCPDPQCPYIGIEVVFRFPELIVGEDLLQEAVDSFSVLSASVGTFCPKCREPLRIFTTLASWPEARMSLLGSSCYNCKYPYSVYLRHQIIDGKSTGSVIQPGEVDRVREALKGVTNLSEII